MIEIELNALYFTLNFKKYFFGKKGLAFFLKSSKIAKPHKCNKYFFENRIEIGSVKREKFVNLRFYLKVKKRIVWHKPYMFLIVMFSSI